jgi:alpha-L-fucosidase
MMRRINHLLVTGLVLVLVATPVAAQNYLTESKRQKDQRMAWWRDARFGMFIHWGLYAVPAGEWQGKTRYAEWIRHRAQIPQETYDTFLEQFNPTQYDPEQWVRHAKRAGMKYIIITAKHHDGFCLWPSDLTEYDIASTPYDGDLLGELRRACDKHDMTLGFYYSIMDWHHPNYPPRKWEQDQPRDQVDMDKYTAYMKGQLQELIENYDPAVLWFDGEWENAWTRQRGENLYQYVRSLKPEIIINNRVGKRTRDLGDYGTPEQEIPDKGIPNWDWETCMTMNRHWGWNKRDDAWKSTSDLIHKLTDIASKGGNYLLNVGPRPDGTFPDEAVQRLNGIGQWMDNYGQAIYGTTASPIEQPDWGRLTTKRRGADTTVYLHVFDWPADGKLPVAIQNEVQACYLLAAPQRTFQVTGNATDGRVVQLTGEAPRPINSVIALDIKGATPQPITAAAKKPQ